MENKRKERKFNLIYYLGTLFDVYWSFSLSRVDEIIYACPDPFGGMTKVNPTNLGSWNSRHWPKFREGPFRGESYNLLLNYMQGHKKIWGDFLEGFQKITL